MPLWLRCKEPLAYYHQGLVLISVVVPFWKPQSEYLQLKDTSPLVFSHCLKNLYEEESQDGDFLELEEFK